MVTTIAVRDGKVYQVWEDVLYSEPTRLRRFWLLPGLDPEWVKEGEPVTELGSSAVRVRLVTGLERTVFVDKNKPCDMMEEEPVPEPRKLRGGRRWAWRNGEWKKEG